MYSTLPILNDPTYEIAAELGQGGGGVVYKAWHKRLQKYVVLKRIKDGSSLMNLKYQRIEVDILKNLKHNHLPQLYDFITDESGTYTVMELISGQSFADILESGMRFSQQQVVRWASQLSSALAYMHGLKPPVLHSDIKPANIMLTESGDLCLIDFNVSLVLDGDGADMIGISHGYASPEQYGPLGLPSEQQIAPGWQNLPETVHDDGTVADKTVAVKATATMQQISQSRNRKTRIRMDTRSDIYSFGATIYHLLTGEKPAVATGNVRPLSDFPTHFGEAIVYIIEKCMERDPAKRFQTAADLHDAILGIHKLDDRWTRLNLYKNIATAVFSIMFVLSGISIMFGWQRMGGERVAEYNTLVLSISSTADYAAYERAIALFPEKIDASHAWALALFAEGSYDECIDYVDHVFARVSGLSLDSEQIRRLGDMLFIQGNAFFELGDYLNAAACFEAAVNNNPENPEFFRDFAITLARIGHHDRAAEILSQLDTTGIGGGSLDLLRGEIAYARGDFAAAVNYFAQAAGAEADIRLRAYLFGDRAFRRLPVRTGERVAFMRGAVTNLPPGPSAIAEERLAEALVHAGRAATHGDAYLREALTIFENLISRGVPTFTMRQNAALLHQELGDFAAANSAFYEMLEQFPQSHEVPMRLAFLELEVQAALPNEQRDYHDVLDWYERARELYALRPARAAADIEMLRLSSIINDLRRHGWI